MFSVWLSDYSIWTCDCCSEKYEKISPHTWHIPVTLAYHLLSHWTIKPMVGLTGFSTVCLGLSFLRPCSSHCIWALLLLCGLIRTALFSLGAKSRLAFCYHLSTLQASGKLSLFYFFPYMCHADCFRYWLCIIAICQYIDVLCLLCFF